MSTSPLKQYLKDNKDKDISTPFIAYLAALEQTASVSPETARSIVQELEDQRNNLKLIASENYSSLATQLSMGNLLTDKYAEGFPGHRFYAGCSNVDDIEALAAEQACTLFGCDHAYVQPHSGADANLIAYWAIINERVKTPLLEKVGQSNPSKLDPGAWEEIRAALGNQRLLGLDYYSGGHLTHGYRHNVSGFMFESYTYTVDQQSGLLDYDAIERQAQQIKPLILLAGYSAYPRAIDFKRMRQIADKVGAVLMVDMAHFAGLVAGGVFQGDNNPVLHAQVVTTTTHKTLRGPRGGLILCTKEYAESVDKGCPLVIGGPLPHVIAAKAIALKEANTPQFKQYAQAVVDNARALAGACSKQGMQIATGGTDNHLFLIDVRRHGVNGRQAESALRDCGITLNRNSLPFDPNGPWYTSGLRIGTPAVTTLGMGAQEMDEIASAIALVLNNIEPATIASGPNAGKPSKAKYKLADGTQEQVKEQIRVLLANYVLYPELDLEYLKQSFS